jgi:hypothetical protein
VTDDRMGLVPLIVTEAGGAGVRNVGQQAGRSSPGHTLSHLLL